MSRPPFETEATEAGEQALAPGLRPITLADRLALRAAAPLAPRRNPNAEQKPCDLGLFDQVARDQLDLIDAIRAQSERSGNGASPTSPEE
ncbi:hypothetical protein [uncultured Erythrobacter sp.]|uniref:hypothetical protein n=1 Tax=uncultured Erythrobacter sp. TaxID=263913 RepID=UPI00263258A3|nr:hypothetical protein [uncultured Erythrobacter sp.]